MRSRYSILLGLLMSSVALAMFVGCKGDTSKTDNASSHEDHDHAHDDAGEHDADADDHQHAPGAHGGMIVQVGQDNYHIEVVPQADGKLRLYMLGRDETRVEEIEVQELTAHAVPKGGQAVQFKLIADRQEGDAEGMTSSFVAEIPTELQGKSMDVTIPSLRIQGERFRVSFHLDTARDEHSAAPPAKITDDAEKTLYLTPGGIYTAADIAANGNQTASQKFAGFTSKHDLKPETGERICPVTLTKANALCTWIVSGKEYQFCCPPCVDEFVAQAKDDPTSIKEPEEYIQK